MYQYLHPALRDSDLICNFLEVPQLFVWHAGLRTLKWSIQFKWSFINYFFQINVNEERIQYVHESKPSN